MLLVEWCRASAGHLAGFIKDMPGTVERAGAWRVSLPFGPHWEKRGACTEQIKEVWFHAPALSENLSALMVLVKSAKVIDS